MIYLIVLLILILLVINNEFKSVPKFSNKQYNFLLLIFILIAGFRYKVGGDSLSYFNYYETVSDWKHTSFLDLISGRFGFLWTVLATTCKSITEDFFMLQLLQSVIVNISVFWFIKKYAKFRYTSVLIYFVFQYFYFNMEIMREAIAISFFLLSYPFFLKRSWLKYYAIVFIAFLFHSSAVILFLYPFLSMFKFNWRGIFLLSLFISGFLLLIIRQPNIMDYLLFTETIGNKYNIYKEYTRNWNAKIFTFIAFILIPYYFLKWRNYVDSSYSLFSRLYSVYFITIICVLFFSGFSRFINYLSVFMIVFFADFLNQIYLHRNFRKVKRILVLTLLLLMFMPKYLYYSSDTSKYYPNTNKINLWYPYSSIFFKTEYKYRMVIFSESMRDSAERIE